MPKKKTAKLKTSKTSKPSKTSIQVDPCQVCFERPRAHGVYRKVAGEVVLLYEACRECHARVVRATEDFDHPAWIDMQKELEKEHKGK